MTAELVEFYVLGDFPCAIWKVSWERVDSLPDLPKGHFNGYIGVPPSHPWYGKDSDEIDVEVHGGLTFAQRERNDRKHNPERRDFLFSKLKFGGPHSDEEWAEYEAMPKYVDKEPSDPYPYDTDMDIWWVGFDCGHYNDHDERGNPLRDIEYVKEQIVGLVRQATDALNDRTEVPAVFVEAFRDD